MEHQHLPTLSTITETEVQGSFSIEPLAPGYGNTLGNSLRRVLLSSLEGAAVDYVMIEGVQHEFSSIPNVKEDVIQILLNLKAVRFKLETDNAELTLDKKGAGMITAADFAANADCAVLNPTQVIATLDKDAHVQMRIGVKRGVGYEPVEKKTDRNKAVGVITTDSIFSPVRAVSYHVENTRVGQMTNFDKLLLDVQTDGSILPSEAVKVAAKILSDYYQAISGSFEAEDIAIEAASVEPETREELIVTDDSLEILQTLDPKTRIEDAGFSGRTTHALTAAGYKTLAGLKRLSDIKLQGIKGLGVKGIEEVKAVLSRVE
jgi:DNA-directed RNA polymerase subunit alpha